MEIETDLRQVKCALADTQTRLAESNAVISALRAAGISRAPTETDPMGVQCSASTIDALRGLAKEKNPATFAQIFAKEIRPIITGGRGNDVLRIIASNAEVMAANSLGTLTGNLIAQRALDLLRVLLEGPAAGAKQHSLKGAAARRFPKRPEEVAHRIVRYRESEAQGDPLGRLKGVRMDACLK